MRKNSLFFMVFFYAVLFGGACKKVEKNNNSKLEVINKYSYDEDRPVVIYGDTRNNYEIHRKIVLSFLKFKPTIVFNTGDLVYDGNINELWPKFVDIIKPILKIADYYPVLGNHERQSENYFQIFNLPGNEKWYKIRFKNTSFYVLDSTSDLEKGSKQYLWLKENLEKDKSKFKVFLFHHPVLSLGRHGGNEDLLKDIFSKYKIDFVFNGHDHAYQRFSKGNTYFIVTGGGGAPLYDKAVNMESEKYLIKYIKKYHYCLLNIYDNELKLSVYDQNNKLIDELSYKR